MSFKALSLLSLLVSISIFNSCLPNCGDHPNFFILEDLFAEAFHYVDGAPNLIDTGSYDAADVLIELHPNDITYVGYELPDVSDRAGYLAFYGFGGQAYACSPAPARTQEALTSVKIFPSETIEFDVALSAGEDISSYFKLSEYDGGIEYTIQDYIDLEVMMEEWQFYQFFFAEDLAAPYNGTLRFEFGFADGHTADGVSQEMSLF